MKNNLLRYLLLTALLTIGLDATTYEFERASGEYEQFDDGLLLATTWEPYKAFMVGYEGAVIKSYNEDFVLDGTGGLAIGTNGFISASNLNSSFAFDGFSTGLSSSSLSSSIRTKVEGEPGKSVLKVQWQNARLADDGVVGENIVNFQIWFYQENGVAEVRFGPSIINEGTDQFNIISNIGYFLASTDFSQVKEQLFLTGDPSNPVATDNVLFAPFATVPPEGTVYRFKMVTSDVEEVMDRDFITLFPNPAEDELRFLSLNEKANGARFMAYDINGNEVLDVMIEESRADISFLPSGAYQYIITRNSEKITSGGFIRK